MVVFYLEKDKIIKKILELKTLWLLGLLNFKVYCLGGRPNSVWFLECVTSSDFYT